MTRQKLLLTLAVGLALATSVVMASQFAARLNWGSGGEPLANKTEGEIINISKKTEILPGTNTDKKQSEERALLMTKAIHEIVSLQEEQKNTVTQINLRSINDVDAVRDKYSGQEGEEEINKELLFTRKKRDEKLLNVLAKNQAGKFEDFKIAMTELQNLQQLQKAYENYSSGKKRFYPEYEAGEYTNLNEIQQQIAHQEKILQSQKYSPDDIIRLENILYNF